VLTDRYWIYKESYLRGPYPADELATMPDFSEGLLVCQDGDDHWLPVLQVQAFQPYLANRTPTGRIISTGDYQNPSSPAA
jgi:hypothetical protein